MRLGGPVFEPPEDPWEFARAHRDLGYRAAYCPQVPLSDTEHIRDLRRAFEKEDVVIAEVGAWCNLLSVDDTKRKANFEFVCERLALAEEIGACCYVDYIGTLDPHSDFGPHADNLSPATFELVVDIVRRILNEVKPVHTRFCLEMVQWTFPDSPDSYLRLIQAVEHPSFKDIVLRNQLALHLDETRVGTGNLDYRTYLEDDF